MKVKKLLPILFVSIFFILSGCGGNEGGGGNLLDPDPESPIKETGEVLGPDIEKGGRDDFEEEDGGDSLPVFSSSAGADEKVGAGLNGEVIGVEYVDPVPRANTVEVYEAMVLDQPDTHYILQNDIVAPGTAFEIQSSNVTLDLNGYSIIYAEEGGAGPFYGIIVSDYHRNGIAIVNGSILQGRGATETDIEQQGWNPIHFDHGYRDFEVAGLYIEYITPETHGINIYYGEDGEIHHNEINDLGSVVVNRHHSLTGIRTSKTSFVDIHHNRITRARQTGIGPGDDSRVYENVVHVDSCATNSATIGTYEGMRIEIFNNSLTGEGEHPLGIGIVSGAKDIRVHSNSVEVQNTRVGTEYGSTGAAGLTIRWGGDRIEVWNNRIIVKAEADLLGPGVDSWGRALWVSLDDFDEDDVTIPAAETSALFRKNTIVAENARGEAKAAAIAVVAFNKSPNLVFEKNLVRSNYANVLLADDYGESGGFPGFIRNTFEKTDDFTSYRTIKSEYSAWASTAGFFDNQYEGGAAFENIELQFEGSGQKEIERGRMVQLIVKSGGDPVPEAEVYLIDESGAEIFTGRTDAEGHVEIPVVEFRLTNQNPSVVKGEVFTADFLGPYANRIEKSAYSLEVSYQGDTRQLSIDPRSLKTRVEISF